MKAFYITNKFKTGFDDIPVPKIGADEVLLKVAYVGLCGSDLNTYRGLNPMVSLPRIPGHEIGAVIEKTGSKVPGEWKSGMKVTVLPYTSCGTCSSCLSGRFNCCRYNQTMGVQRDGALTEYIAAPWTKIFSSEKLSLRELALVEPFTVGNHASDRGKITEDDVVAVFGCGAVGLGAVFGAAAKGAEVIAIDIDEEKLAIAELVGARHRINFKTENLHERLQLITGEKGPNVVIEAVGLPATFRAAVDEAAFAGRVVYIGYAKNPVEYETKYFVQKELDICGSRNADPANFRRVINLFERDNFPLEKLISKEYSFKKTGEAFKAWNADPSRITRILIKQQ
jgi:threonine dehydrogenase-like Zn-dependent dehydrogenase